MTRELAIKVIEIDAQIELLLEMPDMAKKAEELKVLKLELFNYELKTNFTTN